MLRLIFRNVDSQHLQVLLNRLKIKHFIGFLVNSIFVKLLGKLGKFAIKKFSVFLGCFLTLYRGFMTGFMFDAAWETSFCYYVYSVRKLKKKFL